jgi:hypothetical protein
MKIFIPVIFIVICSCNAAENKKNEVPGTSLQDSAKILQTPSGKTINLIDGYQVTDTVNDYILFPLQIKDAKAEEESALGFSKQRGEGSLYWNVVFYNYKTNEPKLLEPTKKILIGGYSFNYYRNYSSNTVSAGSIETHKETPYIFYTVYSDDYNADKKLGTDDPAYFYVSNDDGSNFKQVSPQNISITQKTFPKNNSFLLLEGLKDSNNDKKFDADDEKVYYKVNMTDSALKAEEIFNPSFKISLKKLFDKNWKK